MNIIKGFDQVDRQTFMRRCALSLSLFNILIVAVIIFFVVSVGDMLQGDDMQKPQLSVTGEGKLFVRPNVATFIATVVTDAPRVGDAQTQNTQQANAVIEFIKNHGVKENDTKTINYSVEPQYQYIDHRPCSLVSDSSSRCPVNTLPQIISYRVRNSIEIKVRDLNTIDDLLQGVVSAGANEVGSVIFTVADEKAVLVEVRKQAIDDAQKKAIKLAKDLGVRLIKIAGFSEAGGGPIYYARSTALSVGGEATPGPQIQPGEQEIRSNVTVTYEFR